MSSKSSRSRLAWFVPKLSLALAVSFFTVGAAQAFIFSRPPSDLDLSRSKPTEHGLYVTSIEPGISPLVARRMHHWTVLLTTAQGTPVEQARLTIAGGMPQHGHGLPTKPTVTPQSDGRYRVEGMKFNMGGWWTLTLHVDGPAGADNVTFNLKL